MKILLLSQYDKSQATTRIRLISLKNELEKRGYNPTLSYLINWDYKNHTFIIKLIKIIYKYCYRYFILFFKKYDVVIFNREIFPKLPYIFDSIIFKNSKCVIMDLDDGIHLYYKNYLLRNKINKLVKNSNYLSTANINLYEHFIKLQKNIYLNYPFPDKIYNRSYKKENFTIG